MILLLDTSTPLCQLTLHVNGDDKRYEWQADRQLAKGLLQFIIEKLTENNSTVQQLDGMIIMKGPGSFTGLRIGCTVLNTIAHFEAIPIVGTSGEKWQEQGKKMLKDGINHTIVLPDYGRPARITQPRK